MPKKQLTIDPRTGKLSRLNEPDLSRLQLSDLNEGDPVAPFGSLTLDIIEYCLYDLNDNLIGSNIIPFPFPDRLDIGTHLKELGYNSGTYKIVYNFLRQIGGSENTILVKKSDKTPWSDIWYVNDTDGRIYAGTFEEPILEPETEDPIELSIEENKYIVDALSSDKTEIRLLTNPGINDLDENERFRLLGYTCLCQADISGESPLTFLTPQEDKKVRVTWSHGATESEITLTELMKGGTLIIRDAFVIDYDETPEVKSIYVPTVETEVVEPSNNLATNGHFAEGSGVVQETDSNPKNEVVEFPNPGHSKWCLLTSPDEGEGGTKDVEYQMDFDVIPGETYVLSCWVHHDVNWTGRTDAHFSAKAFINNLDGPTIGGVGTILKTKVIDGKTWERQYSRITVPPEGTGRLSWYLGSGIEKDDLEIPVFVGNRYYTDIQCEPGSSTSLPTPYMLEERLDEEEVPTTGLITFVDDNTVSSTVIGTEAGFVGLMASDNEGRGSGEINIRNAIVIDETFDVQTNRIIDDDIPVDNEDNSVIRESGDEGQFNHSPFHGEGQTGDSTDLNITIQVNDEYRLNRVDEDGNEEQWGEYVIPTDVTVLDEIQEVPSSLNPTVTQEEGELHNSPFVESVDSNELNITVKVNDEYQLNHIIPGEDSPISIGGYVIPEDQREVEEIRIENSNGTDLRLYKGGPRDGEKVVVESPYHGISPNVPTTGTDESDLEIWIAADNDFTLYKVTQDQTYTNIPYLPDSATIGGRSGWGELGHYVIPFTSIDRLLIVASETYGTDAGLAIRIVYKGATFKTGDSDTKTFPDDTGGMASEQAIGNWSIVDNTMVDNAGDPILDWADTGDRALAHGDNFNDLGNYGVKVVWSQGGGHPGNSTVTWQWDLGLIDLTEYIWRYPDPTLHASAVYPKHWTGGFNHFNWSDPATHDYWRTGWVGYHAQWQETRDGTVMVFYDINSHFQNPNHPSCIGSEFLIDGDGNNTGERIIDENVERNAYGPKGLGLPADDENISLEGRGMYINQWLPQTMASYGVKHGDTIKVSWKQRTDTDGKGARVYLRWWRNDQRDNDAGFWTSNTHHGNNETYSDKFIRINGEDNLNTWQNAEFTFVVDERWDLNFKRTDLYKDAGSELGGVHCLLRVHGDYGPEGKLWVKDLEISVVEQVEHFPDVVHSYVIEDFQIEDSLQLTTTHVASNPRGFLAKINYKGTEYKTGDVTQASYEDPYSDNAATVDLPGAWKLPSAYGVINNLGPVADDTIDQNLQDCEWLWSTDDINTMLWNWAPITDIENYVWNYASTTTHGDAVAVEGWSDGYNPFNWGGNTSQQDHLFWHSGWIGHHAKWVRDEGQFGTCIKFIDLNSQFISPNHIDYDGLYGTHNNSDNENTLENRPMSVYTTLPVTLSTQGVQEGSFLKISWWQKTSVEGKGANVGLRHHDNDGEISWGPGDEFRRTIPCTSVDVWEQASYTGVVDEDWDLTKFDRIYVSGQYGPEGILWVEDVKLEIVSGIEAEPDQTNTYTITGFTTDHSLKLYTTNLLTEPNGIIARVNYKGAEYKTGDTGVDYYIDPITNETITVNLPGTWKIPGGNWISLGNSDINPDIIIDPNLANCQWVGNSEMTEGQQIWNWSPLGDIINYIWNYPDPNLRTDAVWPENWSSGFDNFDYGGDSTERFWHTGWVGHHAKFVPGDGRDDEVAMKFIDKNSSFESPNWDDYTGPYKTGNWSSGDGTLIHRPMMLSQNLPHTLISQGIEVGKQITISWRQKSDIIGKGARVGIRHYDSNGNITYGEETTNEYPDIENTQKDREWLRYIPTTTLEWQDVNYDVVVDEDFDLARPAWLCVHGNKGPEGILRVENIEIKVTIDTQEITVNPVLGDFVAEIDTWVNKNTITIKDGYDVVAESLGHISENSSNLHSYSIFTDFNVHYTSSLYNSTPVWGSFRGEIDSVDENVITLVNTFDEIAIEAGHDLDNYPLDELAGLRESEGGVDITFANWFIQYPIDSTENLSKLLRFGPNNYSLITNFKNDRITYPNFPYSMVYKLYEPISDAIGTGNFVTVVREMIPPIEETCQLIPFAEEWVSDIVLRTPERTAINSPIGSGQTEFKNYDQLTTSDESFKQRFEDELLSGSISADINVDHSQFTNFVHFSSVEKRLRNFKYKLELIEQYTDRSASLAGLGSGSTGYIPIVANPGGGSYLNVSASSGENPAFTPVSGSLIQIQSWEKKRREQINSFDKFEKYMWKESSSYTSESIGTFYDNAWPKRGGSGTYSDPYILARTTQSLASDWFDNQITSASDYDRANKNLLTDHIPGFIRDDADNTIYLTFINMISHHFDNIWIYVKSITDVFDKRDKLTEGVAKDLLKPVAQSLGWDVRDGKDLVSMQKYLFGMEQTGSEKPWEFSGTSDQEISREIWSRIINNMPFFLKTKGTSRAIKGLVSCYGIPSTVLRVVEYGGPKLSGQSQEFLTTRKFTKALDFFGASNNTYVTQNTWFPVISGSATGRVPDTVEFRFKAASGSDQVLVRRGDDWAIRLKDNGSSDRYGHVSFMLSGSRGYNEVSSSEFPVYDGEFWSVMLTRTLSGSGLFVTSDTGSLDVVYSLYTKKYDAGRSKIIYSAKNDLLISGSQGVVSGSYNIAYSGSATTITIGGPESSDFGESFSGSMMEYRHWTTALNSGSFDNHVAAPIAFDGNTPSASYLDLVTRYSFDDNKDLSVGANQWFQDVSADQSFTSSATPVNYTSGLATDSSHFSSVVDETKMKVPNLGPSGKSSNKIRIEGDTLIDAAQKANPVLRFNESIVTPAYDNAPIDSNKLGVYFSPSKAIDEDILLSMPNLDFDQYIGDPRDQYKEQYTGLVEARNLYWQKYSGPNNFWDYLRLLKYYDASLYQQIRDLVPARANATVGIVIEPTILERDKIIISKPPTFETGHFTTTINAMLEISESSRYSPLESDINYSHPFRVGFHTQESGSYISASSEYIPLESDLNFSHPFRVNFNTQESGSYLSASSEYIPLDSDINYSHPFRVNFHTQESGSYLSASSEYIPLESDLNFSHPFRVNFHTQESSSYLSASADIGPIEADFNYNHPFRVNFYTQESGSYLSASAIYENIESSFNLYDPWRLNNNTQLSGSGISMSADFSSLNAPSETLGENARETGSFVLKHILERPTLYNIGDRDTSGWYGSDYYNSTIQEGSVKIIFEEVVMPRYENNVLSEFNREEEFYYSSSLSASLHKPYSSSLVVTDLDNRWDELIGTERLFYLGCVQTDDTTVMDTGKRWDDNTPVVDVIITSPTKLVTTDSPSIILDVK